MAIVEMKKISLYLYNPVRESLLEGLQKTGIVHLDEALDVDYKGDILINKISCRSADIENNLSGLKNALAFLKVHAPQEKKSAINSLIESKPSLRISGMRNLSRDFDLKKTLEEIKNLEVSENFAVKKLSDLQTEKEALSQWSFIAIDLDLTNSRSKFITAITGSIPEGLAETFKNGLSGITKFQELFEVFHKGRDLYYYMVCLAVEKDKIQSFLRENGFLEINLSARHGSIRSALKEVELEIKAEEVLLKSINNSIK